MSDHAGALSFVNTLSFVNIGAAGVARRRRLAAIGLAVAFAGLVAIDLTEATFRWRALLFAPIWFASLCWFQASAST